MQLVTYNNPKDLTVFFRTRFIYFRRLLEMSNGRVMRAMQNAIAQKIYSLVFKSFGSFSASDLYLGRLSSWFPCKHFCRR